MISEDWARNFAAEWIAAWNVHDLERILSHYIDDFEMQSALIVERMGVRSGILKGKEAIRPHWQQGRVVSAAGLYGQGDLNLRRKS